MRLSRARLEQLKNWVARYDYSQGVRNKDFFSTLKGTRVLFKVVPSNPDFRVQFVDRSPDYTVTVTTSLAFISKTIRIQIVTSDPDVKLQKVTSSGDFEAYFQ